MVPYQNGARENTVESIPYKWYIWPRGPTLPKIVYEISKSIDFNEIILISSDFTDFKLIS